MFNELIIHHVQVTGIACGATPACRETTRPWIWISWWAHVTGVEGLFEQHRGPGQPPAPPGSPPAPRSRPCSPPPRAAGQRGPPPAAASEGDHRHTTNNSAPHGIDDAGVGLNEEQRHRDPPAERHPPGPASCDPAPAGPRCQAAQLAQSRSRKHLRRRPGRVEHPHSPAGGDARGQQVLAPETVRAAIPTAARVMRTRNPRPPWTPGPAASWYGPTRASAPSRPRNTHAETSDRAPAAARPDGGYCGAAAAARAGPRLRPQANQADRAAPVALTAWEPEAVGRGPEQNRAAANVPTCGGVTSPKGIDRLHRHWQVLPGRVPCQEVAPVCPSTCPMSPLLALPNHSAAWCAVTGSSSAARQRKRREAGRARRRRERAPSPGGRPRL